MSWSHLPGRGERRPRRRPHSAPLRSAARAALPRGLAPLPWLLLSACAAWEEREWREIEAGAVSFEDAWTAVAEVAAIDMFPIDAAATDRGRRTLVTQWRTRPMPFRGSVRRRLHAQFDRPEDRPGWLVKFYVERQSIDGVSKGFQPGEDDWDADGQDLAYEMHFASKLQHRFHGMLPDASSSLPAIDASGR